MTNSSEEIHNLHGKPEASFNNTAQRHQAIAQLEAALSRKENQKITEMSKKK